MSKRLTKTDVLSSYAGIATHYVPSSKLSSLQASLDKLASENTNALELISINRVIESFSSDIGQEKRLTLGGSIQNAINRYGY